MEMIDDWARLERLARECPDINIGAAERIVDQCRRAGRENGDRARRAAIALYKEQRITKRSEMSASSERKAA
jgi:hypothetical protein